MGRKKKRLCTGTGSPPKTVKQLKIEQLASWKSKESTTDSTPVLFTNGLESMANCQETEWRDTTLPQVCSPSILNKPSLKILP